MRINGSPISHTTVWPLGANVTWNIWLPLPSNENLNILYISYLFVSVFEGWDTIHTIAQMARGENGEAE